MEHRPSRLDVASWFLTLGQFGLAFAISHYGPRHPLPMHFDAQGQVDRWGDRSEPARIVLALAVICALLAIFRRQAMLRREPSVQRGLLFTQFAVVWILSLIALLAACLTWGWVDQPGPKFGMVVISSAITVIGAVLGKTSPNALIGVRTPWTFASRLAWDKANRLAGRLFFWGGLAGMIATPIAPQPAGFRAMTFGVLAVAALSVFESWRVWRTDPHRHAH
jgi:uncharacterized membrane protein